MRLILTAVSMVLALYGQDHLTAAREAERRGDLAAAERIYEAEVSRSPSAEIWNRLGLVRHLQNKYSAAIPAFQEAIRLTPGLWTAQVILAIDFYRTNQFTPALTALNAASRRAPTTGQGRDEIDYWLGATRIALGQPLAGLQSLEKLLARQPRHTAALELAAQAYSDLADSLWNDVAEKHFESGPGQEVHGHALEGEGNTAAALDAFRRAQQLEPRRPGPRREAGRLLLSSGKAIESLKELEEERALNPADAATSFLIGLASIQLNRYGDAVSSLERATSWMADDPEPAIALAQVYLALGRRSEAEQAARRAVAAAPNSPAALELLKAAGPRD